MTFLQAFIISGLVPEASYEGAGGRRTLPQEKEKKKEKKEKKETREKKEERKKGTMNNVK